MTNLDAINQHLETDSKVYTVDGIREMMLMCASYLLPFQVVDVAAGYFSNLDFLQNSAKEWCNSENSLIGAIEISWGEDNESDNWGRFLMAEFIGGIEICANAL